MRSAEQISRTVEEWHDRQRLERQRALSELLAILRRAAADGSDWYYWALGWRERREREAEPEPDPDPDSPFQPPEPRDPFASRECCERFYGITRQGRPLEFEAP